MNSVKQEERHRSVTVDEVTQAPDTVLCSLHITHTHAFHQLITVAADLWLSQEPQIQPPTDTVHSKQWLRFLNLSGKVSWFVAV